MSRCDSSFGSSSQSGFSYLWVLMIVAMIGLGLSVAIDVQQTAQQRDKEQELLAIGRQFRVAIERYQNLQVTGRREYPMSLNDLLLDARVTGGRRHLRRIFIDPMTGKAEWGLVRVAGRIAGVYSLSEKTPIKQAMFEPEDAAFAAQEKYSDWVFTYPADLVQRGAASSTSPMPGNDSLFSSDAASGPRSSASSPLTGMGLPSMGAPNSNIAKP